MQGRRDGASVATGLHRERRVTAACPCVSLAPAPAPRAAHRPLGFRDVAPSNALWAGTEDIYTAA
eukprot:COSAG01_NODE_44240_length_421_cov_0.767081_1_plen_64_part_10